MAVDATSGLLTYTPTVAQIGVQPVTVTVVDGLGFSDSQSFNLPVVAAGAVDRPPTITSTPSFSAGLVSTYLYLVVATDPDGDPLSYSLPTAPSGMTIDAKGVIRGKPLQRSSGLTRSKSRWTMAAAAAPRRTSP